MIAPRQFKNNPQTRAGFLSQGKNPHLVRTYGFRMGIIEKILLFLIAVLLLISVWYQISYIKADWCSWEVEKILFDLEDIKEELNDR